MWVREQSLVVIVEMNITLILFLTLHGAYCAIHVSCAKEEIIYYQIVHVMCGSSHIFTYEVQHAMRAIEIYEELSVL